jgi:hypothetical protein
MADKKKKMSDYFTPKAQKKRDAPTPPPAPESKKLKKSHYDHLRYEREKGVATTWSKAYLHGRSWLTIEGPKAWCECKYNFALLFRLFNGNVPGGRDPRIFL